MRRLAHPLAVGASEAVSGEVAAPEMAVSERRGLAPRSPLEWGQGLLLLMLLGGCSGRIHRLALTVSPAAWRARAGWQFCPKEAPGLEWSRPTSPSSYAGWSGPAPPASRPVVV